MATQDNPLDQQLAATQVAAKAPTVPGVKLPTPASGLTSAIGQVQNAQSGALAPGGQVGAATPTDPLAFAGQIGSAFNAANSGAPLSTGGALGAAAPTTQSQLANVAGAVAGGPSAEGSKTLGLAPPAAPNTNLAVSNPGLLAPQQAGTPGPTSAPAPGSVTPTPAPVMGFGGKTYGSYNDYTGSLDSSHSQGPQIELPYDHPLNRAARGEITEADAFQQNKAIGDPGSIQNLQGTFDSLLKAQYGDGKFQGNPQADAAARAGALSAFQYQIQQKIENGEVDPNDPRFLEFIKTLPTADYSNFTPSARANAEQQNTIFTNDRARDATARNAGTPQNPTLAGPPGPSASVSPGSGMRPLLPGGTASDAGGGTPANPLNASAAGPSSGGRASYNLSPLTAENSLIGQQINPGAGVDRYQQAQDALENYRKGTEGNYKADSDVIAANSFGAGRGVSGQNRTRQGDLALARASDLNTKGFGFLNDALTGSIDDSYRDIGIAQQQQGFQKGLSDTAFNEEERRALLEDQLVNSDFGRNLSRETAGYANSPEQWDALLSGQFGNQASAAGNAAAQSFRGAGGDGAPAGMSADDYMKLIERYRGTPTTEDYYDDQNTGDRGEVA